MAWEWQTLFFVARRRVVLEIFRSFALRNSHEFNLRTHSLKECFKELEGCFCNSQFFDTLGEGDCEVMSRAWHLLGDLCRFSRGQASGHPVNEFSGWNDVEFERGCMLLNVLVQISFARSQGSILVAL